MVGLKIPDDILMRFTVKGKTEGVAHQVAVCIVILVCDFRRVTGFRGNLEADIGAAHAPEAAARRHRTVLTVRYGDRIEDVIVFLNRLPGRVFDQDKRTVFAILPTSIAGIAVTVTQRFRFIMHVVHFLCMLLDLFDESEDLLKILDQLQILFRLRILCKEFIQLSVDLLQMIIHVI